LVLVPSLPGDPAAVSQRRALVNVIATVLRFTDAQRKQAGAMPARRKTLSAASEARDGAHGSGSSSSSPAHISGSALISRSPEATLHVGSQSIIGPSSVAFNAQDSKAAPASVALGVFEALQQQPGAPAPPPDSDSSNLLHASADHGHPTYPLIGAPVRIRDPDALDRIDTM
jgi:type II secretory pathway pseudopilin PulG